MLNISAFDADQAALPMMTIMEKAAHRRLSIRIPAAYLSQLLAR